MGTVHIGTNDGLNNDQEEGGLQWQKIGCRALLLALNVPCCGFLFGGHYCGGRGRKSPVFHGSMMKLWAFFGSVLNQPLGCSDHFFFIFFLEVARHLCTYNNLPTQQQQQKIEGYQMSSDRSNLAQGKPGLNLTQVSPKEV